MIALYPFQADRLAAIESSLCGGVRRQFVAWGDRGPCSSHISLLGDGRV